MRRAVVLATLLAVAGISASEAAQRGRCAMPGSTTVRADERARIFKARGDHYGCLRRTGKRYWLPDYNDYIGKIRLASPFVAYVSYGGPSGSAVLDELIVMDLRTGEAEEAAEFGSGLGGSDSVGELIVTRHGAAVWTQFATREEGSPGSGTSVRMWRGGVESTLDPGPDVDSRSLAVTSSGRRAYWSTSSAGPRTARLR